MACSMSRPVEADREADIEVDEDEQICSPYHNTAALSGILLTDVVINPVLISGTSLCT